MGGDAEARCACVPLRLPEDPLMGMLLETLKPARPVELWPALCETHHGTCRLAFGYCLLLSATAQT